MRTEDLLKIAKSTADMSRHNRQFQHLDSKNISESVIADKVENADPMLDDDVLLRIQPDLFSILDMPADIAEIPALVLDFETYYGTGYSLTNLDYHEYVLSPKFKIHGLAIRYPDGRIKFRTDVESALKELQAVYGNNLDDALVVMHNAAFDSLVLKMKYEITPKNIFDTMLMARLLHNPDESVSLESLAVKYGLTNTKGDLSFMKDVENPDVNQLKKLDVYANNDVLMEYQVFEKEYPTVKALKKEIAIAQHCVTTFISRPLAIDVKYIDEAMELLHTDLLENLGAAGYTKAEISGNKSFFKLLVEKLAKSGRSPQMKAGKKGDIPAISKNDEAMHKLIDDDDPEVKTLAQLRLQVKSESQLRARLDYLKNSALLTRGHLHILLEYHKAGTGRFAGANGFNSQNIMDPSKSSGVNKQIAILIRKAITANPGKSLSAADACQIEARIIAFLAGETELHDAFALNNDVYSQFSSEIFNTKVYKPKDRTPESERINAMRNVGKMAILGLGYGMGAMTFHERLKSNQECAALFRDGKLSKKICKRIVDTFRRKYPNIVKFWGLCESAFIDAAFGIGRKVGIIEFLNENGDTVKIRLPSGRELVYPGVSVRPVRKTVTCLDQEGEEIELILDCNEIMYGNSKSLYSGKIVENITQAVARDILVETILKLEDQGYPVVSHIHDEIICEIEADRAEECRAGMICTWRDVPEWIYGLILDAEGCIGNNLYEIS